MNQLVTERIIDKSAEEKETFDIKDEKTISPVPSPTLDELHFLDIEQLQQEFDNVIDQEIEGKDIPDVQEYKDNMLKKYLNNVKKVSKIGLHAAMEKIVKEVRKDYRFVKTFKDIEEKKLPPEKGISDKEIESMSSEQILNLIKRTV